MMHMFDNGERDEHVCLKQCRHSSSSCDRTSSVVTTLPTLTTGNPVLGSTEIAAALPTYVTVHAYMPHAICTATAGVRCIEHGLSIEDETAGLLAERTSRGCLQPFLDDEDAVAVPPANVPNFTQMVTGTDHPLPTRDQTQRQNRFGTDTVFDAKLPSRQCAPVTIDDAELLTKSGRPHSR